MEKNAKNGKPSFEDLIRMDLLSAVSLLQIVLDHPAVFEAVTVAIKDWQEKKKAAEKSVKEFDKVS